MRKIYCILICLLMVAALAVTAMAAGELKASATANKPKVFRGGELEVIVSVSGGAGSSGGVEVQYNGASLELVSGKFLLTGTTLSDFSVADKNGVFLCGASQGISGDLLKCVFKVKADAPFANTDIQFFVKTGSQSTNTKLTVAVVCSHKFGGWTADKGAPTHTHICTICNSPETAEHTWDAGKVTTPSTCAAEGVKTFSCTGCGAQKTEAVAKKPHAWDGGKVTKAATCAAEGAKAFTCTACGAQKTEAIEKPAHTYDNSCDTTCNNCGAERKTSHKYSKEYTTDETGHWYQCTVCKHKKDLSAHKPSEEATEQTAQTCTVCGYIIKAALGHTHDYQTEWSTDATNHWHACNGCDNKHELAEHSFDNSCDRDCNVCGYERETEHIFYNNYLSDASGHWHECRICSYRLEVEVHTPDENGMCTGCGYEVQAENHTHSYADRWTWDVTGHWQICECGHSSEAEPHSWNDGWVAKKPTDLQDGARTYKCTVCGAEKSEIIPMGTVITDSFPWIVMLIVGGAAIVGVIIFVIVIIANGNKKTGKFTEHSHRQEVTEE